MDTSLDEAANILFIGPPGVGKTMLAIALGHAAVDAGHRVYYTTAADLAGRCHRAALTGRWATTMNFFAAPQVLIVDELGYLPLAGEAAAALFQVIQRRYLKGSIILTTNRAVGQWGEIFDDTVVAAAMLDRLLHRATVVTDQRLQLPAARPPGRRGHPARPPRRPRAPAVSAAPAPLTWPPTTDPAPRWAHRLLHAIADTLQRTWCGHEHTRALLADLTHQLAPDRGALAARLRRIATAAVDPHDSLALHELLRRHGHDHITEQLTRAQRHRGDALQRLRDLADADQHRLLDTTRIRHRLEQILDDLTAAGHALVDADHALLTALDIPRPEEETATLSDAPAPASPRPTGEFR